MELSNKPFIHLFRTRNQYYFYDANTCSIIRINETMYDILKNKENFLELEQLKKLYENGFLQSKEDIIIEHPASSGIESYLDEGMQQLILQLTQNCNLRCKYCVYSGSYKNRVHTNKRMTFEIAKEAIDYYYLHSRAADVVRIGLYGGEPLLEFDLIKKITEYCEKIFAGKELRINMTTNATLLNEKIVDFLQKHNFDLMISLDGPESVQNKSRVFADNSHGTFDVIIQKIEMIQKLYPQYLDKISFNAVIDEQNDFACSSNFFTYDFLKDAVVTAAGVSDRDSVQEVSLRETFYINYNYELFKSFIVYAGELDNKYISKLIVSHERDKCILKNIDILFAKSSKTAIIGRNGSGKTTIINLLTRMYEPTSGEILLGAENISELPLPEYRNMVSVVSQQIYLFNDTIRNNICLYKQIDDTVIEAACKDSGLEDFIKEVSLDHVVGQNGAMLSGGQKQKIALARALVHDKPIIIFDEATSNTDAYSEQQINGLLDTRLKDKTVIVITHKKEILSKVDQIVVLKEGVVADLGRYDDLIGKSDELNVMLEKAE